MPRFFNKVFLFLPVSIVIGFPSILAYNAYQYSKQPSKFELAAEKLGFNTHQQEALLNICHLAGYFEPQTLWHDLLAFDKTTNPKEIYTSVRHSLNLATNQNATNKINLKLLKKNLFKDSDKVDIQDIDAWILYVAQNAFDREIGQERNELVSKDWMNKHRDEYFQSAKELGLINEVFPKQQKYDEAWIAGASRIGILARIIHFNKILEQVKIIGSTLILAGARPLWAEIDGIEPQEYEKLLAEYKEKSDISYLDTFLPTGNTISRTNEGKEYIGTLAKANKHST